MAVDPSQLQPPGLPSAGAPPMPGPPGVPGVPGPTAAPPGPPPIPATDPNAVTAVLMAMQEQGHAQVQSEMDQALAQGVAQMMQQMPNQAGMDATSLPGGPVPPTLPGDPNSQDQQASSAGY